MLTPISPRDQYIVYKERERELELAIARRLAWEARGDAQPVSPWYIQAAQWLKARSPFHAGQKPVVTQPAHIEEPCPCPAVPC